MSDLRLRAAHASGKCSRRPGTVLCHRVSRATDKRQQEPGGWRFGRHRERPLHFQRHRRRSWGVHDALSKNLKVSADVFKCVSVSRYREWWCTLSCRTVCDDLPAKNSGGSVSDGECVDFHREGHAGEDGGEQFSLMRIFALSPCETWGIGKIIVGRDLKTSFCWMV